MILRFKVNALMFKAFSYIIDPPAIEAVVEKPPVNSEKFSALGFIQTLFWYPAVIQILSCISIQIYGSLGIQQVIFYLVFIFNVN